MFEQFVSRGIIFIALVPGIYGKLPPDVKPCKAGDVLCIVETINKIIATKYKGDPELNLISIDTLKIPEMVLKQPKNSPVNLEMVIKNGEAYGYKNLQSYKVRGFGANPEGKHEVYLKISTATFLGDYTAHGKIYSLLVEGEGRSNVTIGETDARMVISAGSTVKDGLIYMDVKNVELNMETSRAYFSFSNMFKGNKELSDKLNKFLDDKWHDFYLQVKRTFLDGFEIVYKDVLRKVFGAHPYSELVEGGN